jgi:hypothetical protein
MNEPAGVFGYNQEPVYAYILDEDMILQPRCLRLEL